MSWKNVGELPAIMNGHQSVAYGDSLYVIAGHYGTTTASNNHNPQIWGCTVNTDGTLGKWKLAGSISPLSRSGAVVSDSGFVYLWGGYRGDPGSTPPSNGSLSYAQLQPNGTISGVKTIPTPHSTVAPAMAIWGQFLYCIGGFSFDGVSTTTNLTDCYMGVVLSDGSVTKIKKTSSLPVAATAHPAHVAAIDGFMYLFLPSGKIYSAMINNDGQLGAWKVISAMPNPAGTGHSFATVGNKVLVIGGYDGGSSKVTANVHSFVCSSGNVYGPTPLTLIPGYSGTGLQQAPTAKLGNFVYVLGGADTSGTHASRIMMAEIDLNKNIK